jgi:hypothetical protein
MNAFVLNLKFCPKYKDFNKLSMIENEKEVFFNSCYISRSSIRKINIYIRLSKKKETFYLIKIEMKIAMKIKMK